MRKFVNTCTFNMFNKFWFVYYKYSEILSIVSLIMFSMTLYDSFFLSSCSSILGISYKHVSGCLSERIGWQSFSAKCQNNLQKK